MSKRHLLGVDLGAGSLKASVVAAGDGSVVGEAAHPIATATPRFGWAEQDPEDWYRAFCHAVPAALAGAGLGASDLAAIGVSGGAHIGVLTGDAGQVLRPAILWSDSRSAAEAQELHARAGERIIALSLNRANPTWLLPQLLWLQRHAPDAVAATQRLFIAKDYLRHRITGTWETDFSDVVGALMADAAAGGWSAELAGLIDWPLETLPPVVAPTHVVGTVTARAAAEAGLVSGIPVVCGSNDTTVELFGAGALAPNDGAVKLATAGVVYQVADRPLVRPPISCYPHIVPGLYYTATGTNSCATAHRWVRDLVFPPEQGGDGVAAFAEMDRLAAEVPAGANGLLFHPYLQGERAPHWDPQLRGDFLGLTVRHGRAHMARATYEGIAFSIRDALEAAEALGMRYDSIRLIGGGARSAVWRQIISDVLGREILRPRHGDASFGAAVVAGLGVGRFASPQQAVAQCVHIVDRCTPDAGNHALYAELFAVYRDAQARLAELDHRLHALFEDAT